VIHHEGYLVDWYFTTT